MTSVSARPLAAGAPVEAPPRRLRACLPLVLVVTLAVVARLPYLDAPLGLDEAGYLTVAQQWHPGGSSLYGNLWVDRPPLLVMIFQLAAAWGGRLPLRWIGILATVLTVVLVHRATTRLAGRSAATSAAVIAAALLVTPLVGSQEVNGELLAAPLVALGAASLVESVLARSGRNAGRWAVLAGAAGAAAVLVKQNMLDVEVMLVVVLALCGRTLGRRRVTALSVGFVGGAALTSAGVMAWSVGQGTSPAGVWNAMYPFRLAAARVLAATPDPAADHRVLEVLVDAAVSGVVIVALVVLWRVVGDVRRRSVRLLDSPPGIGARTALAAMICYDVVSIVASGSFWAHYLLELVVPVAVAGAWALDVRRTPRLVVVVALAASSVVALLVDVAHPAYSRGEALGTAIRAASRPGDTIVTVWGHSDVTYNSGLPTPYRYLWSLPARTLDPDTRLLGATLRGPDAPTWFVTWSTIGQRGMDTTRVSSMIAQRYRPVASLQGSTVYLRRDVKRVEPRVRAP